jgi:DMSO/TMAO reductase YedYZ molybdopterin-dependent catalytic subunit
MSIITPGFRRKREEVDPTRVPPGQYVVTDWPVLSAGPTPDVPTDQWTFTVDGLVEKETTWSWQEMLELPQSEWKTDIHCVTRWSKLDTIWEGVWLEEFLNVAKSKPEATYILASCYGGYTTNLPLAEALNKQAMIAHTFDHQPLPAEHGGPARLLVPHLYFWKSAKWINRITLLNHDQPGFWEQYGYHDHGDPWKEERYS